MTAQPGPRSSNALKGWVSISFHLRFGATSLAGLGAMLGNLVAQGGNGLTEIRGCGLYLPTGLESLEGFLPDRTRS
jgi:hypothetical protein